MTSSENLSSEVEIKDMNLPNKLTILRIITIPLVMVFILLPIDGVWHLFTGAAIFLIATLTDMADGKIARRYDLVTDFGKFLDPLADKFLVFGTLCAMIGSNVDKFNDMKMWLSLSLAVIIFRELAVTSIRLVAKNADGVVIAAAMLGKIKTVFQSICIIYLLVSDAIIPDCFIKANHIIDYALLAITVILTVVSGMQYILKYSKYISTK